MMHRISIILLLLGLGCTKSSERVVVYCAQDREFAEPVFADFTIESKLAIAPKFDTEANKSVSLIAEIEAEAKRPRADVHWNNEILGTILASRKGLYEPYTSPSAANYPPFSKSKHGTWQAFAERARVLIVNTNLVPEADRPKSLMDLTDPSWKGKLAIGKPQFGTMATHAACLFAALGSDAAKDWFRKLKANDVQLAAGNKPVATGVSDGRFHLGLTDTDDAILEVLAGKPVAIIFLDETPPSQYPNLGTLFIPNTLALIKDAPNPAGGKRMIDFTLNQEAKLLTAGGYQYPMGMEKIPRPHPLLKTRQEVKPMTVDFDAAADNWDETQKFLVSEFAR
jgi:iron(III) transport system substrate-binding protein